MEVYISIILILSILLTILITFKRKIKNLASEIYELNYDSVTFDDLLNEIDKIKKQKVNQEYNPIEKFLNHPLVEFLKFPCLILLYLITIGLAILIAMFMATMLLIFW
jgi:GTP-binding protein EngB required for normal cell division